MDHFIKEKLKIIGYTRYQDDFILFSEDKENLILNKKTRIFCSSDNYIFLGKNIYGKCSKYRVIRRKIKKRKFLYISKKILLSSYIESIICFKKKN